MSIFLPYTPTVIINYFTNLFLLDLSNVTDFERLLITLFANLYFFVYWFIIIYVTLKILNRLYERLF